jgi:DNA-binding transcriptional MerR regulator
MIMNSSTNLYEQQGETLIMYTMKQVCDETNMTYQTLKYYCNEGLIPNVKRDGNNHRVFDEHDVKWIKDLICLKKCGMSIQEMKIYLDLRLQGESTIPQRKEMLAKKRDSLLASIMELKNCVDFVDWKQNFYDEVLSGKRPYVSNLIRIEDD